MKPFLFRFFSLVVCRCQQFIILVRLHIVERRVEHLVVGDASQISSADSVILLYGIIHTNIIVMRARAVGIFRSRNLMKCILLVIELVNIISDVTSRIVILICEEYIQSSLVDVEVDLLVVRQILMFGDFRTHNTRKSIQGMVYGSDVYDTPCFCIVFCPRVCYELYRLHVGRRKE